jgi:hypothetical protein
MAKRKIKKTQRRKTQNPRAKAKPDRRAEASKVARQLDESRQRVEDEVQRVIDSVVANLNRGRIETETFFNDGVCVVTLLMEEVVQRPGQVPQPGSPGSGLFFGSELEAPSESPTGWVWEKIREHLPVTPRRLVAVIPTGIPLYSIRDDLPKELRQMLLGYWDELQVERKKLHRKHNSTVQQCTEDTESASKTAGDWQYVEAYIKVTQDFVMGIALGTDWDPEASCWMLSEGRKIRESQAPLPTAPDGFSAGVMDAAYDCGCGMAIQCRSASTQAGKKRCRSKRATPDITAIVARLCPQGDRRYVEGYANIAQDYVMKTVERGKSLEEVRLTFLEGRALRESLAPLPAMPDLYRSGMRDATFDGSSGGVLEAYGVSMEEILQKERKEPQVDAATFVKVLREHAGVDTSESELIQKMMEGDDTYCVKYGNTIRVLKKGTDDWLMTIPMGYVDANSN